MLVVLQQISRSLPQLPVYVDVVIVDQIFVGVARNVLTVQRIVAFPESVLDAVEADFDKLEVVPLGGGRQLLDHLEVPLRHIEDLESAATLCHRCGNLLRPPDTHRPAVRFPA